MPDAKETQSRLSSDSKLLASMAILQVNWEEERKSYLDNFVVFIVEAMRRNPAPGYTDQQICALLAKEFSFELPEPVVHSLLRRAGRLELGIRNSAGKFVPDPEVVAPDPDQAAKQAEILRQQRSLVDGYVEYCREHLALSIDQARASSDVIGFIDTYAAPILSAAQKGASFSTDSYELTAKEKTALAAYIEHLNTSKPTEFGYLVSIAKGAMLASSLFRESPAPLDDRFDNTDLYLDTPVIFRALGYFGPEAQSVQLALIAGARQFSAGVKCFEETVAEIKGVIDAVANDLRSAKFSPDERSIGLYFVRQRFSPEEVRALSARTERDLARIGVDIVPRPSPINKLTIDEEALARTVQGDRGGYSKPALLHDVDALTSVFRIRRGRAGSNLERCRALFVTTNPQVVDAATSFPAFSREKFPLAEFEDRVSTLIWIKTPLTYPDLPRDQLVARVSVLLSPSNEVWAKYIEQIDRLRARGTIDADDEILLRQHYEAGPALVTETLNDPVLVTEDSVVTVLERVKEDIRGPVAKQARLAQAQHEVKQAEHAIREEYLASEARLAKRESAALAERLHRKVERISRSIAAVAYWSLFGAISVTLALSFFFDWAWVAKGLQALVLVALFYGSVGQPLQGVRDRFRQWIARRLIRVFELESPDDQHRR